MILRSASYCKFGIRQRQGCKKRIARTNFFAYHGRTPFPPRAPLPVPPRRPPPPPPLPTEGELRLLRVLWARGASTVRDVHAAVEEETGWGYTTVLKLLQIMHGKGLVIRDESQRTHVYAAAVPPEHTQQALVSDLAMRAFGGSAAQLAMRALASQPASRDELEQIRALLDRLERGDC